MRILHHRKEASFCNSSVFELVIIFKLISIKFMNINKLDIRNFFDPITIKPNSCIEARIVRTTTSF